MSVAQFNEFDAQPTLNARVLAQLRADIVRCRLMPSERLRMETLRERYKTGISPIREALMRLEAEGLVELEQNKGFRVAAVSRESLLDLMRARIEIEALMLRWSIENGGVAWEADLLGAFHRLSRQPKIDPTDPNSVSADWWKEHRNFHTALVAACGSPTMLGIYHGLFDKAERYVALSIKSRETMRDDVTEHEQIMRTALARDVPRALRLMQEHIERTATKVAKSLESAGAITRLLVTKARSART